MVNEEAEVEAAADGADKCESGWVREVLRFGWRIEGKDSFCDCLGGGVGTGG